MNVTKEQREAIRKLLAAGVVDVVEAARQLDRMNSNGTGQQELQLELVEPVQGTSQPQDEKPVRKRRNHNHKQQVKFSQSLAQLCRYRNRQKYISKADVLAVCERNGWDCHTYVQWGLDHNRLEDRGQRFKLFTIDEVLAQLRQDFPDASPKELCDLAGCAETRMRKDYTLTTV